MKSAKQIQNDLSYLFKKINWRQSALDAKAINIMNNVGTDIALLESGGNKITRNKKDKTFTDEIKAIANSKPLLTIITSTDRGE